MEVIWDILTLIVWMVLLIVQCVQHEGSETLDRALCTSEALRWQCFATATTSGMYCTILRFRGAVSFNQVPYPAGTVSFSSSCRRRPPWSRLLLALAPDSSQTSPHNLGAPPLQEGESTDDEWQPCGREHPSRAPQHSHQGQFYLNCTQWQDISLIEVKFPSSITKDLHFLFFFNGQLCFLNTD